MITLLTVIGAVALAQELPDDAPPAEGSGRSPSGTTIGVVVPEEGSTNDPRHVIIPDFEDVAEEGGTARGGGTAAASRPAKPTREPSVPPRITRKVPRPVVGDAPVSMHGRYHVVEVTQAAITEDFVNKMERAGRALHEDCIITRQIFDFGPAPEDMEQKHRPREVELIRLQECDVGGLGKYAEESSMILPARWSEGEGFAALDLPGAAVLADFVRVSPPRQGDMPMPPQWLGPDTRMEHEASTYVIIAEAARKGEHPVLHLTLGDQVLHLEPDPADASFDVALRGDTEDEP